MSKIERLVTGIINTNTYFVECDDGEFFVVDPGGDSQKIIERIHSAGKEPSLCVITHAHPDHVGALLDLKNAFPAMKVVAHKNEAELYGAGSYQKQVDALPDFAPDCLKEADLPALDCVVDEGDVLPLKDARWKILHTPGHTVGSICIYNEEEKILLSGDTVFFDGYGRVDLPGGSYVKMCQSLKRLAPILKTAQLFPGH